MNTLNTISNQINNPIINNFSSYNIKENSSSFSQEKNINKNVQIDFYQVNKIEKLSKKLEDIYFYKSDAAKVIAEKIVSAENKINVLI